MLTIDEMHITVQQDLQKINSYANANVEADEIDFHLNRFTRNWVDDIVGELQRNSAISSTKVQDNQRLLDSIHTLHVKNHKLDVYVDKGDSNLVYAPFPSNYRHLVSDASELVKVCDGGDKTPIGYNEYIYPFLFLADKTGFEELELEIEGDIVFRSITNYPDGITGDTKYQLVNTILDNVPNLYWENYGGTIYRNQFIYVANKPSVIRAKINGVTINSIAKLNPLTVYRYLDNEIVIRKPNRLNKDANLDFVRNHPFEKTTWESPLSTIANNKIYVYEDNAFKLKTLVIDYIRRPVTVSKSMAVNSDLPEDAQERILEQTILHLKGIIQDPSWQTTIQQNQLNNK